MSVPRDTDSHPPLATPSSQFQSGGDGDYYSRLGLYYSTWVPAFYYHLNPLKYGAEPCGAPHSPGPVLWYGYWWPLAYFDLPHDQTTTSPEGHDYITQAEGEESIYVARPTQGAPSHRKRGAPSAEQESRKRRRPSGQRGPSSQLRALSPIPEESSSVEEEPCLTDDDDDSSSVRSSSSHESKATTATLVDEEVVPATADSSAAGATTTKHNTAGAADASASQSAVPATQSTAARAIHTHDPLTVDFPMPEGEVNVAEALARKPGRWSIVGQRQANWQKMALQQARAREDYEQRQAAFETTKKELYDSFKKLTIHLPR
jgi:hypothetical protein